MDTGELTLFLMLLNAIMAVMMTSVLNPLIVLLFLLVMAIADLIAEARPQWGAFAGFILPAELEFVYTTPHIMLALGRVKLRSSDLLWYALLVAALPAWWGGALFPTLVCALAGVVFATFYAPYAGLRVRRPLPFVVAAVAPVLAVSALCGVDYAAAVTSGVFG